MEYFTLPSLKNIRTDFLASLSLVILAIPLCLGIAHASGAPFIAGLIAGIVGGIVVGYLSESKLSVSGPAAGLTTICLASISELGSYQGLVTALLLAGLFQILFGFLKFGAFSHYIPTSVIKGMLSAIGLMLILKQFPHLVGFDSEAMGVEDFTVENETRLPQYSLEKENTFSHLLQTFENLNYSVILVGLCSLGVLIYWDYKYAKKYKGIPGYLVAVILSTLLSLFIKGLFNNPSIQAMHLVSLPNIFNASSQEQLLTQPSLGFLGSLGFYKIALTIAMVASLESLLSIEAIEKLDPIKQRVNGNRELIAQGVGNMVSACLGGLPLTSVIVRGSVNISAGAQSKWSTILHGFLILLSFFVFRSNY